MKTYNFTRIVGSILLGILLYSCKSTKKEGKDKDKKQGIPVVDWIVAKTVSLNENISISGTIKPLEETVLLSEVSGRITKINLTEGAFVKKGSLLVKIFDEDLQSQLRKSQAQLQLNQQTLSRQAELLAVNGISQSEYDQTALQINSIKADIAMLNAQIRKTEVLAPYDGVIGLRNVSEGAVVTTGLTLAIIRDVSKIKIDFSVPEKYSTTVNKGTPLEFEVQGRNEKFKAVVVATEQGIDASTRNLKARAIVTNTNSKLLPGAFATIFLRISQNNNAILVPSQAIVPQEDGNKLIVVQNGKASFVSVTTGLRQTSGIEITKGIAENDTVITTGVLFVKPDSPVKLRNKKHSHETHTQTAILGKQTSGLNQ